MTVANGSGNDDNESDNDARRHPNENIAVSTIWPSPLMTPSLGLATPELD